MNHITNDGMSSYGNSKQVSGTFDEVVSRTTEALKNEGFGVLTTIDMQAKFKEKLDVEYDKYLILGACSPKHAYQAIQAEKEIGLLLPCNVIVYQDGEDIIVSAMRPTVAMSFIGNSEIEHVAAEVESALKRVIDTL